MDKTALKDIVKKYRFFILIILCIPSIGRVYAQNNLIKGTIQDKTGIPILGATVMVKGSTNGVISDMDGKYEIKAEPNQTLSFSYMGFITQNIHIGNRHIINVVLHENETALDEVVVVGYGTQMKRNIVGSVDNVSGKILKDKPNANVVRSLQGQIAGVNISMVDGKPSRSSSIQIRGAVNSIGAGGSALVLVDGVEGDITTVNPDDVESISVLKDASSCAVYGARGAFGVVLVTTKNAEKGSVKINYSGNVSFLSRTIEPEVVTDNWTWYQSYYDSYFGRNAKNPASINNIFPWNEDWVRELQKRSQDDTYDTWRVNSTGRYEYFGNTDWHDIVYADWTTGQQHNLSFSGGNDKANYYLSGRFFDQNGIYNAGNEKFQQFNVRAKGSIKLTEWLTLNNNTDFIRRKYHQPRVSYTYEDRLLTINRMMEHQAYPMTLEKNPDGTWTETSVYMGWAGFVEGDSYQQNFKFDLKNTTSLTADVIKNVLKAYADFTYLYNHSEQDRVNNQHEFSNGPGLSALREEYSDYENRTYNTNYWAANATLTYTPNLADNHSLSILGGWNAEEKTYTRTLHYRTGLLVPDRPNFSLMNGTNYTIRDLGSYSWAFAGIFFRGSYAYKGKYLGEVSGRYDGTSKFPTNQQWGFFPSASLGWRVSEEPFMQFSRAYLDNMKFRLSAGTAGNGLVDPYQYLSTMDILKSTTVLTNGTSESYTSAPNPIPLGLTWEKTITYDLGLDLDFFRGRLNFTGDIYRKYTKDMYTVGPEIPAVAGYSSPKGNYANMRTNGWEVALGWNDSFNLGGKDFTYNIKASLWDSKSKITKYTSETGTLPTIYSTKYYEGMTIGEIWGYHVLGLFETDEEAAAWGKMQTSTFSNNSSNTWEAGDLKFADLDNSGEINNGTNTIGDHGDLKKIGNTSPRYCYGINLGANWYGVGLSMFWQGVGKRDWYPAKESSYFWGHYGRSYGFCLPWQSEENRWTEENRNADAYWPRLRGYAAQNAKGTMSLPNDRYLQNAAYLRLKNVTLSYTVPTRISKKAKMELLRVYVSGDNLLTFTPLHKYAKNFDPEVITAGDPDFNSSVGKEGDGYGYPQLKSISIGVNITL